jgi:hypothetical protein
MDVMQTKERSEDVRESERPLSCVDTIVACKLSSLDLFDASIDAAGDLYAMICDVEARN